MTESNSTIGYQFTPMPKKLMHVLDVNLRSMLFALVDASNKFADDENGWFYRTNDQLQQDSDLSKNLVNATVDTLFQHSLVEVSCIGMGKGRKEPNGYKLNVELFKLFELLEMNDIHRPENRIKTVNYKGSGYHPSYLDDDPERLVPEVVKGVITWKSTKPPTEPVPDDTSTSTTESTNNVTKSEHNINNIESVYNKDNKDYIDNKEYIEKVNNKSNTNNELSNKYNTDFTDSIPGNSNNFNEKENKENLEREFERELTEPNSISLNEGKENSIDTSSNQKSMKRDPSISDIGDSERKSKDEIEAEETPCEYQSLNQSEANQDSVQDDVQEETGGESSSNPSQSNGEDAGQMQDAYTSSTTQSPLDDAVTGTQMVGLFDSDPLQENQETPQLSVRAKTRKWAEELETKYQGREETLRYLAIYDPWDFEKYVNYLRLQQRPAFMRHLELISSLASSLGIDVDLDL